MSPGSAPASSSGMAAPGPRLGLLWDRHVGRRSLSLRIRLRVGLLWAASCLYLPSGAPGARLRKCRIRPPWSPADSSPPQPPGLALPLRSRVGLGLGALGQRTEWAGLAQRPILAGRGGLGGRSSWALSPSPPGLSLGRPGGCLGTGTQRHQNKPSSPALDPSLRPGSGASQGTCLGGEAAQGGARARRCVLEADPGSRGGRAPGLGGCGGASGALARHPGSPGPGPSARALELPHVPGLAREGDVGRPPVRPGRGPGGA